MNRNFGYARCSTNESKQDINRQVRELKSAGAEGRARFKMGHTLCQFRIAILTTDNRLLIQRTFLFVETAFRSTLASRWTNMLFIVQQFCTTIPTVLFLRFLV